MAKGWKFEDKSKEVKQQISSVSEEAMEAALLVLEARAKALAPVQTGLLRDSLNHQVRQQNGDIIGVVGSDLEYAIYVEYGKNPVPYLNRAKSVKVFNVYNLLDNLHKKAYNLVKEMIICKGMQMVDLLRVITRIIPV